MRTYKPVRPRASRQARMTHAAHLRSQGLSLRQIAARQGVSHDTVWRDLARWDQIHAHVSDLPVRNPPPRGADLTAVSDSRGAAGAAEVIPLRRTS